MYKPELLTFDEATHTYRYDGKVAPSVTQVMARVGTMGDDGRWRSLTNAEFMSDDRAARFGSELHRIIEHRLLGIPYMHDPVFDPWIKGFDNFMNEVSYLTVEGVEVQGYCHAHNFAGTMDLHAKDSRNDKNVYVIDWKSSTSFCPHWRMQTAAYEKILQEIHPGIPKHLHRWTVRFDPKLRNGYEIDKRFGAKDSIDWSRFQSVNNVLRMFG